MFLHRRLVIRNHIGIVGAVSHPTNHASLGVKETMRVSVAIGKLKLIGAKNGLMPKKVAKTADFYYICCQTLGNEECSHNPYSR